MKADKLLSIISSKNSSSSISISGNDNQPYITYKDSEGNIIKLKENSNSLLRPIKCSEVIKKLRDRDWNITERKFISKVSKGENSFSAIRSSFLKYKKEIDEIDTTDSLNSMLTCSIQEPEQNEVELFRTKYKEILKEMDVNEIYLYNSSKGFIDLLNKSVSLDIIKQNSDIYTNTIDINDLYLLPNNNNTVIKLDISIQYSKFGKVLSKDLTFTSSNDSKSTSFFKNQVSEINNEVRVELINGVIKVFPLNNNINECIISNCTVIYGNF